MSGAEYSIDDVLTLLRYMPKAHEGAAADIICDLRQQLEAAEARADKAEAAIREAREQEPAIVVKGRKVVGINHKKGTRVEGEFYATPVAAMPIQDDNNPALAAIQFALDNPNDDPVEFLQAWFEGDFDCLRRDWDGVPDSVFIGADPLFKREVKPS